MPSDQSADKFLEDVNGRTNGSYRELTKFLSALFNADSAESEQFRLYEADVDDVLVKLARQFLGKSRGAQGVPESWSRYHLEEIWRFLMGRYAFREAMQVGAFLADAGERWPWSVWRGIQYFLPRLIVGLLVGFLAIQSSSGLEGILRAMSRNHTTALLYMLGCACAAYALGFAEVQQRTGRRLRSLMPRSLMLFGIGAVLVYAGYRASVGAQYLWSWPVDVFFNWTRALTCWPLAFVVQLFWRDKSVGDPL
jgi:hypothetical protein